MKKFYYLGFIGPSIFILATLVFGFLYPGYSHVRQLISELGAEGAPHATAMNYLGIIPFGLCVALFALGGLNQFLRTSISVPAFFLLFLAGLLFLLAGLYNCDPLCSFESPSTNAILHNVSAMGAYLLVALSQMLLGLHYFTHEGHATYWRRSLLMALLSIFLMFVLARIGWDSPFRGLVQRLFVFNICGWLILTAVEWRDSRRPTLPPVSHSE